MENSLLNPFRANNLDRLNPLFSYNGETFDISTERDMIDSLNEERLGQFGYKGIYLPRLENNKDVVYGESIGKFKYQIEIPVDFSTEGMDFRTQMAQWGYDMQDTLVVDCSYRLLNRKLTELNIGRYYPLVGDQLYIPFLGTKGMLLEINYVDCRTPNNPLGDSMVWKLSCQAADLGPEKYVTRNETLNSVNEFDKLVMDQFNDIPEIVDEASDDRLVEPNAWEDLSPIMREFTGVPNARSKSKPK